VFNNVMLSAILGIVLVGTLYPLLAESLGAKVSVGPPYFNPVGAIFAVPMLLVLAVGPLLRWRRDSLSRIKLQIAIPAALLVGTLIWAASQSIGVLPALGLALSAALAVASLLPLRGRKLRQVKLPLWGMVTAHFGIAVALLGMASDAAFTTERLVAARPGDVVEVGPWQVKLQRIEPVAGPNWTALRGDLAVSYKGGAISELHPAARTFWAPANETNEAALKTRWNGQLYAVLGQQADGGRWQLRLWWKPFVPMIWYGGILIALGGLLALFGRLASDLKRLVARDKIAYRRARQGR